MGSRLNRVILAVILLSAGRAGTGTPCGAALSLPSAGTGGGDAEWNDVKVAGNDGGVPRPVAGRCAIGCRDLPVDRALERLAAQAGLTVAPTVIFEPFASGGGQVVSQSATADGAAQTKQESALLSLLTHLF